MLELLIYISFIHHHSMIKHYSGTGFINSAIDSLPFELHLPGGYQYCGPGTKLQKRLLRGDPGINLLDVACKEHDIAYSQHKDLKERHVADKVLQEKAWRRFKSKDASIGEKLSALAVTGAMKAKTKLGMSYKEKRKQKPKPKKRSRTLKTGGFLPALLPLIGKALLAGVASGVASYGTKKALGGGMYLHPYPHKRGGKLLQKKKNKVIKKKNKK